MEIPLSPREICGRTRDSAPRVVTEAVREKLAAPAKAAEKRWMKHFGELKHLHKETTRITRLIEED